ncbi:MAG: methionyl-tRNA formyltransferase [Desulfobacteraceae bacterium]|nr:methionyl-tRNA formyltransferase [Desulfobacteraceae bacterium]MBC2755781.1 methionyl-tRNA formyltransferase [Desulfobacteraceae bacterium]
MGTPDFAVPALKSLNEYGCQVSLVVTQPDKPKGRGRKLTPPPVKVAASALGFPVIQPESVKTDAFYHQISKIAPDLMVVVAFGHVLPKKILEIPTYGAINIHASLLPKYRGPAPIQWAIINGETETGVTTMLMDKGLDTGEILLTLKTSIRPDDTAATLHDRLALDGAEVLKNTLKGLESQSIHPVSQQHALATYASMLTKKDGRIDWALSARKIEQFIRGMTPWPGAFTFYGEKRLKIFKAAIKPMNTSEEPGKIIEGFSNELRIATGDGVLLITEIQGSSGKRLNISDFLRGCHIPVGTVFT